MRCEVDPNKRAQANASPRRPSQTTTVCLPRIPYSSLMRHTTSRYTVHGREEETRGDEAGSSGPPGRTGTGPGKPPSTRRQTSVESFERATETRCRVTTKEGREKGAQFAIQCSQTYWETRRGYAGTIHKGCLYYRVSEHFKQSTIESLPSPEEQSQTNASRCVAGWWSSSTEHTPRHIGTVFDATTSVFWRTLPSHDR